MHDRLHRRIGHRLLFAAAILLFLDGMLQIASPPPLVAAMRSIGFPADAGPRLAVVTLSCALLLALPATRLVGAVVTTGFLGGAIALHVRIGEFGSPPQLVCAAIGLAIWTGLVLADPRLRAAAAPGMVGTQSSADERIA